MYSVDTVSVDDLLELWVEEFYDDRHLIVIHNPLAHSESLKKLKIPNNYKELYKSKLLTLSFKRVDHALLVYKLLLKSNNPPYCQLYCNGKYLTDSIEEPTN